MALHCGGQSARSCRITHMQHYSAHRNLQRLQCGLHSAIALPEQRPRIQPLCLLLACTRPRKLVLSNSLNVLTQLLYKLCILHSLFKASWHARGMLEIRATTACMLVNPDCMREREQYPASGLSGLAEPQDHRTVSFELHSLDGCPPRAPRDLSGQCRCLLAAPAKPIAPPTNLQRWRKPIKTGLQSCKLETYHCGCLQGRRRRRGCTKVNKGDEEQNSGYV